MRKLITLLSLFVISSYTLAGPINDVEIQYRPIHSYAGPDGAQRKIFRFIDEVDGKKIVCYAIMADNEPSGMKIHCLKL